MSVSETMKNHMDAVRGVTGVSGLLNMAMATDALNGAGSLAFKSSGNTFLGDLNFLTKPGLRDVWLKPVKSSPEELSGSDEGSFVMVLSNRNGSWLMQIIKGFYHVELWQRYSTDAGKSWSAWTKIGGGN